MEMPILIPENMWNNADIFSVILNGNILSWLFLGFLVGYFLVSIVLFYHWFSYGMRHIGVLVAEIVYLSVSIALFIIAFLSLSYI